MRFKKSYKLICILMSEINIWSANSEPAHVKHNTNHVMQHQ